MPRSFSLSADNRNGAIAAALLVTLIVGGFVLLGSGHRRPYTVASAVVAKAAPVQQPEASSPRSGPREPEDVGLPFGLRGKSGDAAPAGGGGAGGSGAWAPSGKAENAADALRMALQGYKGDASNTQTLSISTLGNVRVERGSGLTTMDGLPSAAVNNATMVQGDQSRTR